MTNGSSEDLFYRNLLARRAQAGDKASFSMLYDLYLRPVYDFIYHKTFHRETAQDLTQTVFLKALANLDKLDTEAGSFPAWLFAIARNSVIDHFRARRPGQSDLADVWDLPAETDLEIDAINRERYAALHGYLHVLDPVKREMLILRIWHDLSFSEIAALQGTSTGACKMAFHRLLKQIRREMPALLLLLLVLKS